jgi:hypothetical protein
MQNDYSAIPIIQKYGNKIIINKLNSSVLPLKKEALGQKHQAIDTKL